MKYTFPVKLYPHTHLLSRVLNQGTKSRSNVIQPWKKDHYQSFNSLHEEKTIIVIYEKFLFKKQVQLCNHSVYSGAFIALV